jgi:hypothetical protein
VVDFGFGFGEGFCAELADGVLKRKRRAEGFCRGIVLWGCGGTRGAAMARAGWGDATVAREWGRIAETRWRGVTGSGRRCVGLGQVTFTVGLIGGVWKVEREIVGVYCVCDYSCVLV